MTRVKECLFECYFSIRIMPKVKDIMTKNVVSIDVGSTFFEAAELMCEGQPGLFGNCGRICSCWDSY